MNNYTHSYMGAFMKRDFKKESEPILSKFNNEMNPIMYVDNDLADFMQNEYSLLVVPMGIVRKMIFTEAGRNKVKIHSEKVT